MNSHLPRRPNPLLTLVCLFLGIASIATLLHNQTPLQAMTGAQSDEQCNDLLLNGGFETTQAWTMPITAFSAGYSTEQVHSGVRSGRAGITHTVTLSDNVFSYSTIIQNVQIPTKTLSTTLSFWWYPLSSEGDLPRAAAVVDEATLQAVADGVAPAIPLVGDRQYALLLSPQNKILARLLWTRNNAQGWQQATFDLSAYAGQTVRVLFGVYNDGENGVTAMYIDDVSLLNCPQAAANYMPIIRNDATSTPTATFIPTAITTPTLTVTPSPSVTPIPSLTPIPGHTPVWSDPDQPIEVFSPVGDGIYHSPIQVNGFSRTFEGSVHLRLTDSDGAVLAERSTRGGSVDGFDFFESYLRFTVGKPISATVEIFESSPIDGSEINKVEIPVLLMTGQRVIDLNTPAVGAKVCSPVLVEGYSNTFEANVVTTLNRRDGTQLALETGSGGNLGIYADFYTTISHTVTLAQPLLVGAYEESAAGIGLIDQTRVPIELHPSGSGGCP